MLADLYLSFIKQNIKYYILFLITLLSVPLNQIILPHYYGKIIDNLKDKDFKKTIKLFIILLAIWIIINILRLLEQWAHNHIWTKFYSYVKKIIFTKILNSYRENYEEMNIGEIVTKMIKLPNILESIQDNVQEFIINSIFIIISNFSYLYYHHKSLGYTYLLGSSILLLIGKIFNNSCKSFKLIIQNKFDKIHGNIGDALSNLISIYTNKHEDFEIKNLDKDNSEITKLYIQKQKCLLKFDSIFTFANIIIFIALNATTIYLYKNNMIPSSSIVPVFILNYSILGSLDIFYNNISKFINFKASINYFNNFLDSLPKETSIKKLKIKNNDYGINIKIKNLFYKYPTANKNLYNGLNIDIPANQKIIIMGHIGSGKSTFAKLLVGLHKYTRGDILINNVSLTKLDINNVRNNIIYIPQSPNLFNRTLWENISYGLPTTGPNKFTQQKLYSLLQKLNMDDILLEFKEKMNKNVGKNGSLLSGGQRQLVWLLRCLFKKTKVVIIDEPTNALDIDSKNNIIKIIDILTKDRTLIIITHDKDLLNNMDRLIVFKNGNIIKDKMLQ